MNKTLDAIKPLKDEVTLVRIFQKDRQRLDMLKWQVIPDVKLSDPELIRYFINHYTEHQQIQHPITETSQAETPTQTENPDGQ